MAVELGIEMIARWIPSEMGTDEQGHIRKGRASLLPSVPGIQPCQAALQADSVQIPCRTLST